MQEYVTRERIQAKYIFTWRKELLGIFQLPYTGNADVYPPVIHRMTIEGLSTYWAPTAIWQKL